MRNRWFSIDISVQMRRHNLLAVQCRLYRAPMTT